MNKSKVTRYTTPTFAVGQDERIEHDLKQLGLEGMLPYFKILAERNIKDHATPKDYLEALLERQRIYKEHNRIQSRIQQAKFGKPQTLEEFNFDATIDFDKRLLNDLASYTFIKQGKTVVFVGQSGVGKTHLARALGMEAIKQGFTVKFVKLDQLVDDLLFKYTDVDRQQRFFDSLARVDLLIIDEIKICHVNPSIQEFLYKLIDHRYEQKSTILTSNKAFSEWKSLFGEYEEAALDRILDQNYFILVAITGESYRIHSNTNQLHKEDEASPSQ